jgi:enterochelin esterase-like enzyme
MKTRILLIAALAAGSIRFSGGNADNGCSSGCGDARAQTRTALAGTRQLKSNGLIVEIDDPASPVHSRFNRTAHRFSPTAMVLSARYNGKEFFYLPADGAAAEDVGGAPMEFDLGEPIMNKPPGFEEAVKGATDGKGDFLKVGVGILRRDNDVYAFIHDYPVVELAETQAAWDPAGDKVIFLQTLKGTANGYACELEATILARGNQMIQQYILKNTGRKKIVTEQYVHNFVAFSGRTVGPDVTVRLPYDFRHSVLYGTPGSEMRITPEARTVEFLKELPQPVKLRLLCPPGYAGVNEVTVSQTAVRQSITIDASLPPNAVDFWCSGSQVSPEMLVLVEVEPGQEKHWTRTYTFTDTVSGQAAVPAVPNRRPVQTRSPEALEDGRVTFRLAAPKADSVTVSGQWTKEPMRMEKDTSGIWTVTVGPVPAGVWEYSFQVDGLSMIDPGNPQIKPMRQPRTSILQIPGKPPMIHDFQDVPHGTVRSHAYFSKSLNRLREFSVYTPPGYDKKTGGKYPVLYLQHGSGDNQATWTVHGKAHWILDNLIAQGKARPMLVVMMDGHAAPPGGDPSARRMNTELFGRDLLEDVMPFVEANYRVKKGAENRAICGLSMGGGQSLTIGLNHPELFGWVAGFSAGVPSAESIPGALADPAGLNRKLKLLWIACGKDDFLLQRNEEFIGLLKQKGISHEWHLTDGDHSWPVWRVYLADLAPRLFR